MRARESQIHTQTDGWIDGELTEQNIESDVRRKRSGKKAGMITQIVRREIAKEMERGNTWCLNVRH